MVYPPLLHHLAAPLRKALNDSRLGAAVIGGGIDDDLKQPCFTLGLKGVDPAEADKVRRGWGGGEGEGEGRGRRGEERRGGGGGEGEEATWPALSCSSSRFRHPLQPPHLPDSHPVFNHLCNPTTTFPTPLATHTPPPPPPMDSLILTKLQELADSGFSASAVEAAVNTIEFSLRENNTGSFPRGLSLMLRAVGAWIYDQDPFTQMQVRADGWVGGGVGWVRGRVGGRKAAGERDSACIIYVDMGCGGGEASEPVVLGGPNTDCKSCKRHLGNDVVYPPNQQA